MKRAIAKPAVNLKRFLMGLLRRRSCVAVCAYRLKDQPFVVPGALGGGVRHENMNRFRKSGKGEKGLPSHLYRPIGIRVWLVQ